LHMAKNQTSVQASHDRDTPRQTSIAAPNFRLNPQKRGNGIYEELRTITCEVDGIPASAVFPSLECAGNLVVHLGEGCVVGFDPLKPLIEPVFTIRATPMPPVNAISQRCYYRVVG